MFRARKSVLAATATFLVLGAAIVLAAPNTAANVSNVSVSPGSSFGFGGTRFGTGCSYTVTVEGSRWANVWFDDSVSAGFDPIAVNLGGSGRATTTWTPHETGWHRIDAWSPSGDRGAWVNVGTGIDFGSACLVR